MCVLWSVLRSRSKSVASAIARSTGCKDNYSLMLPPNNRIQQCVPDAMHTVKDVIECLFHLVIGKDSNNNVQQAEEDAFGM